ncbi:MAG: Fis family transcriptional regulator [Hyphomicrobiales bacterium]|nr:MAG: Fis family transcriptional regulator [Hyphomicrobiales bacterium]
MLFQPERDIFREMDDLLPLLEAIVSYIDEGVILTDRDGLVLYQNPAAGQLLGHSGNMPLQSLADIKGVDLQDALEKVVARARAAEEESGPVSSLIRFEMQIPVEDDVRDLEFHCCRACEAQGNMRLVIIQDRTNKRQLETLLDRASGDLVTKDPTMLDILDRVEKVAPMQAPVLLQGESGTGKTHIARLLHRLSRRSARPFVEVNCAAIPESLLESELFGHVKGAFTGANQDRQGRFKAADGGTLFLDEIAEIPMHLQAKLLRALQDGAFEPVGSDKSVKVDVRIISASNRHLRELVDQGYFRADLYYRLAVFPLHVPAIRERPGDIPLLLRHFCRQLERRGYPANVQYSPEATNILMNYPWPGNVRELENAIEHAMICSVGNVIRPESLPQDIRAATLGDSGINVRPRSGNGNGNGNGNGVHDERERIEEALANANGNKSLAAKYLGVDRTTLWRKMRRLKLDGAGAAAG